MKYLDKNSLFQTVDNVSEVLLFDLEIDPGEKTEIVLAAGLDYLKRHRDANGKWKGFPFFYIYMFLMRLTKS